MPLSRIVIACALGAALGTGIPDDAEAQRRLNVCVVYNNALTTVPASYSDATGDTIVQGRRFSNVHPLHSGYASAHSWFRDNETLAFGDEVYSRYGLPRVLGVREVVRVGTTRGVGVYAEPGGTTPAQVVYLPVRQGCEFQPYGPARAPSLVAFAQAAYHKRDFAAALRVLRRPTVADDGPALALLGQLYHFGYAVGRDTAEARSLYTKAIARSGSEGYTGLGDLAASRGDYSSATSLYRTGVARGSTNSAARLAGVYLPGQPPAIDPAVAARMLRVVLTRPNVDDPTYLAALGRLGRLYESGQDVSGDAVEWFAVDSLAAIQDRGDAFVQFRMGRRYEMGWGTWPDTARALSYYRIGARGGDTFNTKAVARLTK